MSAEPVEVDPVAENLALLLRERSPRSPALEIVRDRARDYCPELDAEHEHEEQEPVSGRLFTAADLTLHRKVAPLHGRPTFLRVPRRICPEFANVSSGARFDPSPSGQAPSMMLVLLYVGALAAVLTSIATSVWVAMIVAVAVALFVSYAWATK